MLGTLPMTALVGMMVVSFDKSIGLINCLSALQNPTGSADVMTAAGTVSLMN